MVTRVVPRQATFTGCPSLNHFEGAMPEPARVQRHRRDEVRVERVWQGAGEQAAEGPREIGTVAVLHAVDGGGQSTTVLAGHMQRAVVRCPEHGGGAGLAKDAPTPHVGVAGSAAMARKGVQQAARQHPREPSDPVGEGVPHAPSIDVAGQRSAVEVVHEVAPRPQSYEAVRETGG